MLESESSISWNIRKAIFWENIWIFWILELQSSISWNIRFFSSGRGGYFGLGLKNTSGSSGEHYSLKVESNLQNQPLKVVLQICVW